MDKTYKRKKGWFNRKEEDQREESEKERKRIEKEEKAAEKAFERKKKRSERKELIETTITLRTKDLAKEVEVLCSYNIKLALLTTFGAVLTALSTINELGQGVISYFDGSSENVNVPIMGIILCLTGLFIT